MDLSTNNLNEIIKALKDSGLLVTKNIGDKNYSIGDLYNHRLALFRMLCQIYKDRAWKTKIHSDGSMFNDSFLVGIETGLGMATYHFKLSNYDLFDVKEIEMGPEYDGYTPDDVLKCLISLPVQKSTPLVSSSNIQNIELNNISSNDNRRLENAINELILVLKDLNLIKATDISDGNHTMKELYKQKRVLFKLILDNFSEYAWKSYYDSEGKPFSNDTFAAGFSSPLGEIAYVFNNDSFNFFDVEVISKAPFRKNEIHNLVFERLISLDCKNYTKTK